MTNIVLIGSKYFGATVLEMICNLQLARLQQGLGSPVVIKVVVPAEDDKLALAANLNAIDIHVLDDPKYIPAQAIPDDVTDMIITAHSHARVSELAIAKAKLGAIGYHPSLLPRHRGKAAVEWTVKCGDPIAGGSIYRLADKMDAGQVIKQDWCFVNPGETARELWDRALSPIGLQLLHDVLDDVLETGTMPNGFSQDERFATLAP